MIHISKILVPVDFSDASQKALVYGLILAARFKAKLVAAHIVPESSTLAYAFPAKAFAIEGRQLTQATKELQDLLSRDYVTTIETDAITQIGRIDQALLGIVKDHSI